MKKLLSLPPNLVGSFHEVTGLSQDEYFCTCDPVTLKTIVRANPGIVVIKNGVVQRKLNARDLP